MAAPDADWLEAAVEPVLEAAGRGEGTAGFRELLGARVFLKAGLLRGSARWRFLGVLGRPLPARRELANLLWLRARLFLAPRPLAAAWISRRGIPRFQALLTEAVPGAETLPEALRGAGPAERRALLDELTRELARLHAVGFAHRDLFPRNLVVASDTGVRRIHFLDVRRGGRARPRRGAAYDLGCLMLEGAELFAREEQARLFARYLDERRGQGRPVEPAPFLAAVRGHRARLLEKLRRRPARARGRPLPPVDWVPPWIGSRGGSPRRSRQGAKSAKTGRERERRG